MSSEKIVNKQSAEVAEIEGVEPTSSVVPIQGGGTSEFNTPAPKKLSYTLAEIWEMKFPEPAAIVEGFIFKENISLIAARPKVGKSTLARYLAKCIACGEDFLGRKVVKGTVLYLASDEPDYNPPRDFQLMGVEVPESIHISYLRGVTDKFRALRSLMIEIKPDLVVVDTLASSINIADINDYMKTGDAIREFRNLSAEVGSHICLVHHSKKGETRGNDSVLGSTALTGGVDLIVTLDVESDGNRSISSSGRSGEFFERSSLAFNRENKTFSVGPAKAKAQALEELIYAAVLENPGMDTNQIRSSVNKNRQSVIQCLKALVEHGSLRKEVKNRRDVYVIADFEGEVVE